MLARLSPLAALDRWAVGAQRTAQHNARVAATGLARRRLERVEVEAYLAARAAPAPGRRAVAHR